MTTATRLAVLDPTVEPIPAHAVVAQRPDTLDGKVIGLLANGKRNSVELLEAVSEVLADRSLEDRTYTEVRIQVQVNPARRPSDDEDGEAE